MKTFFLWPAIVALLLVGYKVYDVIHPCNSGFFIGWCAVGAAFFEILLAMSLILYAILYAVLHYVVVKRFHKTFPWFVSVLLGLVSSVLVFGWLSTNPVLSAISSPFLFIFTKVLQVLDMILTSQK